MRESAARRLARRLLAVLALWLPTAAAAQLPAGGAALPVVGPDEIEARVHRVYFEGFPVEAAAGLTPAAVARLGELLESDADREYWSNVVLALGASGRPQALAPLLAFASRVPQGEVDSALYQTWMALPIAFGHLARSYPPALAWLEDRARQAEADPGWSFRALRGDSLGALLRRRCVTGLAVSGRDEAEAVLRELASEPAAPAHSAEWIDHLDDARALRARVARDGADSVFGPGARGVRGQ